MLHLAETSGALERFRFPAAPLVSARPKTWKTASGRRKHATKDLLPEEKLRNPLAVRMAGTLSVSRCTLSRTLREYWPNCRHRQGMRPRPLLLLAVSEAALVLRHVSALS
eukprot:4774020-Heterocapsa_arctica.AAC.1